MDRELLGTADKWARRYGRRPSELLLCDDPLAAALDLAAMGVGEEIVASLARSQAGFPVIVLAE